MSRLGPLGPRGRVTASAAHRGNGAEKRSGAADASHLGRKVELGRAEDGPPGDGNPRQRTPGLQLLPAWPWPGASFQALCLTPFVQL